VSILDQSDLLSLSNCVTFQTQKHARTHSMK